MTWTEMIIGYKSIYSLLDWADSLVEYGSGKTVACGMMAQMKEKLREAYKAGVKDGRKEEKMSAQRTNAIRSIC